MFVFVGSGLIMGVITWGTYNSARSSDDWPTVTGTIIYSDVYEEYNTDDGSSYYPDIEYRYVVNGITYENDDVYVGGINEGGSYSRAEEVVVRFPLGKEVPVYYNPEIPQESALIPGVRTSHYIFLITAAVFFIAGLSVFIRTKIAASSIPLDDYDEEMDDEAFVDAPTERTCAECYTFNPEEATYCEQCGEKL
jgi:hypothetical protein